MRGGEGNPNTQEQHWLRGREAQSRGRVANRNPGCRANVHDREVQVSRDMVLTRECRARIEARVAVLWALFFCPHGRSRFSILLDCS